jgi:2-polyprenyl-3-methyl-5-hydroxy-6-metoxy-1,4-benzoquinol methylase
MSEAYTYPGEELALFEHAKNWKKYFAKNISQYIRGQVLEVGAGIGGTTRLLFNDSVEQWSLMEPDLPMQEQLKTKLLNGDLPVKCRLLEGTLDNLDSGSLFDCIIYIDVLEHIEHDTSELKKAASHLRKGGYIIVLSPAFQSLFSPFDKAIGHYRRYTKKSLKAVTPASLQVDRLFHLDSVGYFASLVNRMFLKQAYPTLKQVQFWDRWMIPVSKLIDKLFFNSFGKSIVGIWKK